MFKSVQITCVSVYNNNIEFVRLYSGNSLTGTSRGLHREFQLLRVQVIESNEV